MDTIRNPIEWSMDKLREAGHAVEEAGDSTLHGVAAARADHHPAVRRIGLADLRDALAKGIDEFGYYRTEIERAHVSTSGTNSHLVHRLPLETKQSHSTII